MVAPLLIIAAASAALTAIRGTVEFGNAVKEIKKQKK